MQGEGAEDNKICLVFGKLVEGRQFLLRKSEWGVAAGQAESNLKGLVKLKFSQY